MDFKFNTPVQSRRELPQLADSPRSRRGSDIQIEMIEQPRAEARPDRGYAVRAEAAGRTRQLSSREVSGEVGQLAELVGAPDARGAAVVTKTSFWQRAWKFLTARGSSGEGVQDLWGNTGNWAGTGQTTGPQLSHFVDPNHQAPDGPGRWAIGGSAATGDGGNYAGLVLGGSNAVLTLYGHARSIHHAQTKEKALAAQLETDARGLGPQAQSMARDHAEEIRHEANVSTVEHSVGIANSLSYVSNFVSSAVNLAADGSNTLAGDVAAGSLACATGLQAVMGTYGALRDAKAAIDASSRQKMVKAILTLSDPNAQVADKQRAQQKLLGLLDSHLQKLEQKIRPLDAGPARANLEAVRDALTGLRGRVETGNLTINDSMRDAMTAVSKSQGVGYKILKSLKNAVSATAGAITVAAVCGALAATPAGWILGGIAGVAAIGLGIYKLHKKGHLNGIYKALGLNSWVNQKAEERKQLRAEAAKLGVVADQAPETIATKRQALRNLAENIDHRRAAIVEHQAEHRGLEEHKGNLTLERSGLNHELSQKSENHQALGREIARMQAQSQDLGVQMQNAEVRIGRLKGLNTELTAATGRANQRLSEIDAELATNTHQLAGLRHALDEGRPLLARAEAKQQELHALEREIQTLAARPSSELTSENRESLQMMREDHAGRSLQLQALQPQVQALRTKAQQADALEQRNQSLAAEIPPLRSGIADNEQKLQANLVMINELRDSIGRNRDRQRDLDLDIGTRNQTHADLGREVDGLRQSVASLGSRIDAATQAQTEISSTIEAIQGRIASLGEETRTVEHEIQTLQDIPALQATIQRRLAQLGDPDAIADITVNHLMAGTQDERSAAYLLLSTLGLKGPSIAQALVEQADNPAGQQTVANQTRDMIARAIRKNRF